MNKKIILLVVLMLAGIFVVPIAAQPIAHYTFDDGTATDVSGNGYDGTLLGDPNAAAQVVEDPEMGHVLQLNGRGMQVDGPFDIATSFTLASWIKIDIPRVGRFFSGGPWWFRTDDQAGSDHTWIEVRYPEGQFLDKFNTATEANPEGQLDGQWHHYAFVLDDTGKFIAYFDGVPAPARDGSERAHDFAGAIEKIFFGTQNENFGNALQGYMDDIRVFNYAVEPNEIPVLLVPPRTIAKYTFDYGTATDVSGNGYDGTLLGDPNAAAQVVEDPEMGHVLQLNGRGMQVDGPFDIATSFTLASWIKIDIPRVGRFFSGGPWWFRTDDQAGSDHTWIEVRYPEGQFLDKFNTATEANPEGQLDGQWHHYAFVLDDTGKFIAYFDGVPAPARDGSERAHDFAGAIEKIFFGTQNENFGNALQGYMDDITLYNVALNFDAILGLISYQGAVKSYPCFGAVDVNDDPLTLAWNGVEEQADLAKVRYLLYVDPNEDSVKSVTLDDMNQMLLITEEIPVSTEAPDARASYTLPFGLDPDTTYYWRVDTEVVEPDATDPNNIVVTIIPGAVWNFRTQAKVAPVVPLAPISSLEATGDDGDILSINGIPVVDLILGTSTFATDPPYKGNEPNKADDFSLATYASADGQQFIETVFAEPVTKVFLIERGGNDTGMIVLFDENGFPVGLPMNFSPDDFFDTGFSANGQPVTGIVISAEMPFTKVLIIKPASGDLGIDPISVSGM